MERKSITCHDVLIMQIRLLTPNMEKNGSVVNKRQEMLDGENVKNIKSLISLRRVIFFKIICIFKKNLYISYCNILLLL